MACVDSSSSSRERNCERCVTQVIAIVYIVRYTLAVFMLASVQDDVKCRYVTPYSCASVHCFLSPDKPCVVAVCVRIRPYHG